MRVLKRIGGKKMRSDEFDQDDDDKFDDDDEEW